MWREAFIRQARSDFDLYRRLSGAKDPPVARCHILHYLQMTTEKLAKAWGLPVGNTDQPPRGHAALVAFLRVLRNRGDLRDRWGFRRSQFQAYIDGILPLARRIQDLAPAIDPPPCNPEYPWRQSGGVTCPADYSFPGFGPNNAAMAKLLRLIEDCLALG